MGTPGLEHQHDAMGDLGGLMVPAHIRHNYTFDKVSILDVGAGWGKYAKLLTEYEIDACEIWKPYVDKENLKNKYRQVFVTDICDLEFEWYDIIIMGDVLEHIERERAVELINRLKSKCQQFYLVIPFNYHQGEVDGNKYEIHHQNDLTDDSIRSIYGVKLLAKDDTKGVYIK